MVRPAVVSLVLLSLSLSAAAVALNRANMSADPAVASLLVADVVLAMAFPVVAAVILWHQSRNRIGWALLLTSFVGPYLLAGQYALAGGVVRSTSWPGVELASWVAMWGFMPYFVVFTMVPLMFLGSRTKPTRWNGVVVVAAALVLTFTVLRMLSAGPADVDDRVANPWAVISESWQSVGLALSIALRVLAMAALVGLALKLRSAEGPARAQIQWLALGVLGIVAGIVATMISPLQFEWVFAAGMAWFAFCIGVAMLRHGLFDVDRALNRSIVYGLLTVAVLGAYAAVVAAANAVVPETRLAWGAVAVAALIAAAAHDQVQSAVDRMLYGARRNPMAVVVTVREAAASATDPVDAAQATLEALAASLRLPYAASGLSM